MLTCKDDKLLLGYCLIAAEENCIYCMHTVQCMWVCVCVASQPLSVLLFSNEEQKTDRRSACPAKQAFGTARVFKVFSLDAPHDGRHAVCTECSYVRAVQHFCALLMTRRRWNITSCFSFRASVERKLQGFCCCFVCLSIHVYVGACVCVYSVYVLLLVCVAGCPVHQESRCPHRRALPTIWPQRN